MKAKAKAMLLLLLAILGTASGASILCSTECSVASAKFSYAFNKTYSYIYSGAAEVWLKGVEDGVVASRWESQVLLTWLTPCDVAISFSGSSLDGEIGSIDVSLLERYPLVVATMDGRVQRVCNHPDDDKWSVNLKKGVASVFQNSLPSLSAINSGLSIVETDVVGMCPTMYKIWSDGDKVVATKKKNHRLCDKRFATPDEVHLPWLKGPLPIQKSRSKCTQNIINGIISSVVCEDTNVVRFSYGAYKFVEATMASELLLVSDSAPAPASISRISQVQLVPGSLLYDYETPKKELPLVPELEQTFRHICQLTKHEVEPDIAKWVDKAVRLMRRVPDHVLPQMYTKIRSGQLCADHDKLMSLFLDAISFVHESGSVPVMVRELTEGRANEGRAVLYSAALYLTPRPTASSIEVLRPLFELPILIPSVTLSAASMVNTFCRQNNQCAEVPTIRIISEALNTKLLSQCSPFSDQEAQYAALLTLKALSNIGFVNQDISTNILRCMRTPGVPTPVRVAAAHTFRLMGCEKRVTEDVVDFALDPEMNTEVRLASYLTVVHCANDTHLEKILIAMTTEENTQVRGFILSHLLNMQETSLPHKKRLRHLLTNVVLPKDFEVDLRKYSRSFDLSYLDPSPGLSAELESSLIYAHGSLIPRFLGVNLTAALEEVSMNVAELGIRVEGLEPILARLFGPEGYFKKSSFENIFDDFFKLLQKNGNYTTITDKAGGRQKRSTETSILANILNEIYHNNIFEIKGDSFFRILGQDIFFSSASVDFSNMNPSEVKTKIISAIYSVLQTLKLLRMDTARMLRPELDYSFPTIFGSTLKLNFQATVVAALKLENNLNRLSAGSGLKLMPSLLVDSGGFIGYDVHFAKMGLKMVSTISSNNGVAAKISGQRGQKLQLQLDLPDEMNIINAQTETFLMKNNGDQTDTKVFPPFMQDIRIRRKSCATSLESVFGLRLCYDVDVPDVFLSDSLPLGAPAFARLSLNRTEASMKGFLINATLEKHANLKVLTFNCQSYGSRTTREFEIRTSVLREPSRCSYTSMLTSSRVNTTTGLTVTDTEREKSIEIIGKFQYDTMVLQRIIGANRRTVKTSLSQEDRFGFSYGDNLPLDRSNQLLELSIIRKSNGSCVNVDIHAGTRHALVQYIDLDIEMGIDVDQRSHSRLMPPVQLRKFEFECSVGAWNVTSFIRKSVVPGRETKYSSVFNVTRAGRQLACLQSDLHLQGTPAIDYVAQFLIQAGLERIQYKGETTVYLQREQKGGSLRLISIVPSTKTLVRLEAMYTNTTAYGYAVQALVEVPRFFNTVAAVVGLKPGPRDEPALQVEAAVQYGPSILLHVKGPLTMNAEQELIEIHVQWMVSMLEDRYNFESMVAFGENVQVIQLKLQTPQGQPLFQLDLAPLSPDLDKTNFQTMFFLMHYIDVEAKLIFDGRQVHGKLDCLIFPGEQDSRRVRVSGDVDLTTSKLSANVWWDADRDLAKQFYIEVSLATLPQLSDYSSIQGVIRYQNRTCTFLAVKESVHLRHSLIRKTSFVVEVQTRKRKDIAFEFENSVETRNSSAYFETKFKYFGPDGRTYKFRSSVDVEDFDGLQNSKVESQITYSSETGQEMLLTTEMAHQTTPTVRLTQLKGSALVSPNKTPLETDLTWMRRSNSMSLVWRANETAPWTLMDWQLGETASGTVESCSFILNLRAVEKFMKDAAELVTLYKTCLDTECAEYSPNGFTNAPNIQLPNTNHSVTAQSSGVLPAVDESHFLASEMDDRMYTVAARYSHDERIGWSRYEGKVRHPTLTRDVTGVVQYRSGGGSQQGTFVLDIFPDLADKITGSLTSVLLANNTVRVEANLTTRLLSYHPKVTLNTAASPHTLALSLKFYRNCSREEVNFATKAKFDRITDHGLALALTVATEGSVPLDVTGVVVPRRVPECQGLQITAVSAVALLGSHDSTVSVCGPAFLELTTARRDRTGKAYNARFGVRNPLGVEGRLVVHDKETQTTLDVLKSQFSLFPHIDSEFSYMKEELDKFEAEVRAAWQESAEGVAAWTGLVFQAVVEEARRQHLVFPPPQITALTRQIHNNLNKMFTYLAQEKLKPTYELLKRLVNSPTVSYVKKIGYTTWLQLQRAKSQLPRDLYHPYQEHIVWSEESQTYNYVVKEVGKQVVDTIQSGGQNLLPAIQYLWRELESTEIFLALKEDMKAFVISHSDPEKLRVLLEVLDRVLGTLQEDLAPLRNNPALLRTAILTLRAINSGVKKITLTPLMELRDMLWAYNSYDNIPINRLLWLYDSVAQPPSWRNLLPPWNRTAMVVGGTEILTFDGAKLRIPLSRCEVILASFAGNKVTLSHPLLGALPQVTVATARYVVVVKPDFHVMLNGRDIGHRNLHVGEVTISVTYALITIELPFVKVKIFGNQRVVSIEVQGWTFGHLAGMLGTFDGEAGNDRLMSTGIRAPDLWHLVKSWQEDQHCPTPPVAPIDTLSIKEAERVVHCYPLLGVWARCNALLRPDPFIDLCHRSRNPCDAAQAYRSLCGAIGVVPLLPRGC